MAALKPFTLRLGLLQRVIQEEVEADVQEYDAGLSELVKNVLFSKYSRYTDRASLTELFADTPGHPLFLNTSGYYHHLTYGVLQQIAVTEDVGYVHIDNHPDVSYYDSFGDDVRHCSFVANLVEEEIVEEVLLVGSEHPPLRSVCGKDLWQKDFQSMLQSKLQEMPERVYVSIDLDIFSPAYMRTSFDQGVIDWKRFAGIIGTIRTSKDIVGADVAGLERPYDSVELLTYSAVVDSLLNRQDSGRVQRLEQKVSRRRQRLGSKLHRIQR